MVNAIPGRNLPVLNFAHHLTKPWTDQFVHVNGKQEFCTNRRDGRPLLMVCYLSIWGLSLIHTDDHILVTHSLSRTITFYLLNMSLYLLIKKDYWGQDRKYTFVHGTRKWFCIQFTYVVFNIIQSMASELGQYMYCSTMKWDFCTKIWKNSWIQLQIRSSQLKTQLQLRQESLKTKGHSAMQRCSAFLQSKPANTDSERGHRKCPYYRGVCLNRVEFKENVRAYFHQGHGKLSVIMRCLY